MESEASPFDTSAHVEVADAELPTWEFVWTIAIMGASFGFLAAMVNSGGDFSSSVAWPLVPLVAVAAERWRKRARR